MTLPNSTSPADITPPSPFLLTNVLLRQRRVIVTFVLLTFIMVVAPPFLKRRTWTSFASFIPASSESAASRMAGMAAQFGIAVSAGTAEQSPQFYADLVRTRELALPLVTGTYEVRDASGGVRTVSYLDLMKIKGTDSIRMELGMRSLRKQVATGAALRTGVVGVTVSTPWPEVSQELASRVLAGVNDFNLRKRQTQAAAQQRFIASRVDTVRAELRAAEDRQLRFLQANRDFRSSPLLIFEQERLARDVAMRQMLFNSLSQSYEQAKIDAVRDTPAITIIERPGRAALPDTRRLVTRALIALVVGAFLGLVFGVVTELVARARTTDPDSYRAFNSLLQEAVDDLRWLLRRRARAAD